MGVKDLMTWIKKTHPSVIRSFAGRWSSPELRGRKVAIDGTLITHRYHFACKDKMDERYKAALRGWYELITDMKLNGVQPVVIWDEKGDRPWKAPEVARRIATRSLVLARKVHEDRRARRLSQLRGELMRFAALSTLEQDAVRLWWYHHVEGGADARRQKEVQESEEIEEGAEGESIMDLPTSSQVAMEVPKVDVSKELHTAEEEGTEDTVFVEEISMGNSEGEDVAVLSIPLQTDLSTLPPHVFLNAYIISSFASYLQHLSTIADAYINGRDGDESREAWEDTSEGVSAALKMRLDGLQPPDKFTESLRQRALSDSEARVLALAFGTPGSAAGRPDAAEDVELALKRLDALERDDEEKPKLFNREALRAALDSRDSVARLDAGITHVRDALSAATGVRGTYVSTLLPPSDEDHAMCRDLLERMGVPVLSAPAPFEAEGFASAMALRGAVDFVGTEDSDVIVYGAPLLRNVAAPSQPLIHINSKALRPLTGMQEGSFRDFCILLGTDASPRIPKVGPVAAAKYMRMYKNVEKMLSLEPVMRDRLNDMYRPEESAQIGIDGGEEIEGENAPLDGVAQFLAAIDNSRRLFAELPPTPTYAPQRDYEDRTVRDWLQSEHGIKVWVRVPAARFREKHASKEIEAELELAPDAVTVATLVAEMAKVAEREAPAAVLSASVCAEPYSATRGRSGRKDVSWDDIPIDEVLPGPRMQNAPVLAPFDEGR